jgi:hypothetical protein
MTFPLTLDKRMTIYFKDLSIPLGRALEVFSDPVCRNVEGQPRTFLLYKDSPDPV